MSKKSFPPLVPSCENKEIIVWTLHREEWIAENQKNLKRKIEEI
ncbi:MAG: hypothetical protein ABIR06_23120 [Cyclobacteriaceae bacterium]